MKKLFLLSAAVATIGLASCREDRKVPDPAPSTPPVENPKPAPSPKMK